MVIRAVMVMVMTPSQNILAVPRHSFWLLWNVKYESILSCTNHHFFSRNRNSSLKAEKTLESYTALIWQKEASDKSDISRKRAKCVCHLHWRQWNIRMSYLTYLLVGWVFLHEIWRRRRAHYVNYENINNSNLDGMSLASFCQSRAV